MSSRPSPFREVEDFRSWTKATGAMTEAFGLWAAREGDCRGA